MWLVKVDMCYADNSPNTTLQSKTGKNHHCSITYMHLIWLATEMDTVVAKFVAQDPSSICYHPKGDTTVKSHAKPIPSRWSTGAPALLKIAFSSLLWSFLTPNTSTCIIIFWIVIMIILFILIFLSLLMQNWRVCLCQKLF